MADIPASFEEHITGIARLRLRFLREYILPGDRILDIGCSFGALLRVLRDEINMPLVVTGVNPEESLAEFARKEYGLDVKTGMFEELDFKPESFDFIILDNVARTL